MYTSYKNRSTKPDKLKKTQWLRRHFF